MGESAVILTKAIAERLGMTIEPQSHGQMLLAQAHAQLLKACVTVKFGDGSWLPAVGLTIQSARRMSLTDKIHQAWPW
jgi:hypothetical protein